MHERHVPEPARGGARGQRGIAALGEDLGESPEPVVMEVVGENTGRQRVQGVQRRDLGVGSGSEVGLVVDVHEVQALAAERGETGSHGLPVD
jgi:hypothetical protein